MEQNPNPTPVTDPASGGQSDPQPPPTQPTDGGKLTIDADTLAKLLAQQQQPPAQPQPQLDEASVKKLLKVVNIEPQEVVSAFGVDDEARAGQLHKFFTDVVQRVLDHVYTVQDLQRQHLMSQFQPLFEAFTEFQNQRYENEFFEQFADLKPYAEVARLVYRDMLSRGVKFPSKETAFKAIAEQTKRLIGAFGGNINNNAGQGTQQMPTVLMGGRPSGPASTQPTNVVSSVKELFG